MTAHIGFDGELTDYMLMIGSATHDSVKIWVKGKADDEPVHLVLHRFNDEWTAEHSLAINANEGLTAVHKFTGLLPDAEYWCEASIGEYSTETEVFKTFPVGESGKFTFMVSGCNRVVSKPLLDNLDWKQSVKAFRNLDKIADESDARFMLHTGDQIYIDTAKPKPEVNSEEAYRKCYRETWGNLSTQQFFSRLPHFMILDDHELCNEFDNDLTGLHRPVSFYKECGLHAYREFQHCHNPDTPADQYYYSFAYGDVHFFVMDVRTERHMLFNEMISEKQLSDFFDWLDVNHAKRKFVISGVPFLPMLTAALSPKDKWTGEVFSAQREAILRKLLNLNTKNLVFLSGDVHAANRTRIKLSWHSGKSACLWELISGPINQDIINGDAFFVNHHEESPIAEAFSYDYKSNCYTGGDVFISNFVATDAANVMVITIDGDTLDVKWLPIQTEAPPLKELRINLATDTGTDLQ